MKNINLDQFDTVAQARSKYLEVQTRYNDLEKQAIDLNQLTTDNRENTDRAVDEYLTGKAFEYKDVQQQRTSTLEKINGERRIAYKALEKAKRAAWGLI